MIEELEINGFRLLKSFKADLKKLNVIIGANGTGKSSLIDLLHLISSCCEFPLNNVRGNELGSGQLLTADGETNELNWKLTFRHSTNNSSPFMELGKEPLVYDVKLKPDSFGRVLPLSETLRNLNPLPGYDKPLIFLESTPYKRKIFDKKQNRLISFDEVEGAVTSSINEPLASNKHYSDTQLEEVSEQSTALLLSQMRFRNEYPVLWKARPTEYT